MKKRGVIGKLSAMIVGCAMAVSLLSTTALAKPKDEKYQRTAEKIAEEAGTETVKTIRWMATTKMLVDYSTDTETGKKVSIPAGTKVTVIQRDYRNQAGISQCMLSDGTICYIKTPDLYFYEPLATGADGDYTKAAKEAYVNGQKIVSNTDTLLWISLDKQRVNIFKGSNRNWSLVKSYKCSTGKADAPTLDITFKKKYVVQKKSLVVNGLYYYTFFYGSGIHKWPGSEYEMKANIGKTPLSHSCVRVTAKSAMWIFDDNNVPVNSRVWIW